MSQPALLPLGHTTWSWVKQGGIPTRLTRRLRLLYAWRCFWFERNLALQRRLPSAQPLRTDPVFILGLWRSGTTYLHELLSASPGLKFPATWQCMNPASFRLGPRPASAKAAPRPMDSVTVDALSPQEDEFALLALGVPSVYRAFLDPRRLPDLERWLDPENWSFNKPVGWVSAWREFLVGTSDGRSGRLVLKSPNHTFRLRALAEIFPEASYVWLVRDPIETFLSNRKMWAAMFAHYALWNWEPAILSDFLAVAFESAAACLGWAVDLLPPDRLVVLDYAKFTHAPLGSLKALNGRLCLGTWEQMRTALEQHISKQTGYRPDTYQERELPEMIRNAMIKLGQAQDAALLSHGL